MGVVLWVGLFIPGVNSGQMGGYTVYCGSMADKQDDIHGHAHWSCKDKAGASKRNKGNVLTDMVDVQQLVGRTRRQAVFA